MKKLTFIFILILLLPKLSINYSFSQCPPVGNPFNNNGCFAGVQEYLARAIDIEYLNDELGRSVPGTNPDQRIANMINTCVDLQATLLVRCVGTYGIESRFQSTTQNGIYFNSDINTIFSRVTNAYDCAGLRRPIIQAGIYEYITTDVNNVAIPTDVISAFANELGSTYNSEFNYYFTPSYNGQMVPKQGLTFNFNRISYNPGIGNCPAAYRYIEARMWLYMQAKFYIDRGYTSLHMGQVHYWGELGTGSNPDLYTKISDLMNLIRNYANSKGSFVFITAESVENENYVNPYDERLIFDYSASALRPKGVTNSQFSACNGQQNAVTAVLGSDFNSTRNSPLLFGKSGGGLSPLGCNYPIVPYSVYFDFGAGINPNCQLGIPNINNSGGADYVWGV